MRTEPLLVALLLVAACSESDANGDASCAGQLGELEITGRPSDNGIEIEVSTGTDELGGAEADPAALASALLIGRGDSVAVVVAGTAEQASGTWQAESFAEVCSVDGTPLMANTYEGEGAEVSVEQGDSSVSLALPPASEVAADQVEQVGVIGHPSGSSPSSRTG